MKSVWHAHKDIVTSSVSVISKNNFWGCVLEYAVVPVKSILSGNKKIKLPDIEHLVVVR